MSQIDWIEIKSVTQMLSHCKYFNNGPARRSWNEIAFYKCSPNRSSFHFSPLFFLDTVSLLCVLQVSIKDFPLHNNAQLQGSQRGSSYHLSRQLEASLITSVLQSGTRQIRDTAKKSRVSDILHHAIILSCIYSLWPQVYSFHGNSAI